MEKLKYAAQDIFCAAHSVETSWTFSILNAGCAAGNHLEKETVAGVEPTCFAPGFSSEIICAACAETLRESVALALTEHSYEWYRFIARKPYRKQ